MRRIFHPYHLWEETRARLWAPSACSDSDLLNAVCFMHDVDAWAAAMVRVTTQWKFSCEQNLSHEEHNRVAWLGQAAVCLAMGLPESVTRRAWWLLTEAQRTEANKAAELAIRQWEQRYEQGPIAA